ncbi:MAG: response regulator, partial [Acidobacteriota bacterium]
ELVRMHGGDIEVESEPGKGTIFRVSIPFGSKHLPEERIAEPRPLASRATTAGAYVEEALRWLPVSEREPIAGLSSSTTPGPEPYIQQAAHILLVDDNADMRAYVRGLLEERWRVSTATNGAEALELALKQNPDLVLTDVMMPQMDGFELIRAFRAEDRLKHVPVIILTARTGEEARIEGLTSAADDYLAKPFSARELIARIEAHLTRAWLRRLERTHYERLLETFRHAPVAIAIVRGPEHIYEFANDRYLQLIGRRSVLGQPIRRVLPELAKQGVLSLIERVYQTGDAFRAEALRTLIQREEDATPEERFFDVAFHPSRDDSGRVSGVVIAATEVTLLANARRDAEAANRAKDEFLAMLGHELRNPLAPILTALQLMRLRDSGSERERAIIERQVTHVVRLVDDLLDVSRITRGKLTLQKQRVTLAAITAKAIEMASPLIEQRQHLLSVDVPRTGCEVFGDAARLAQVLANLLNNAAKYTEPGGRIWLSASAEGDQVTVSVRDSGIGIAPESLASIFDIFAQGRQALDRAQGGLGLGLAIVKSLVALHGGSVWARSDGPGTGSEFVVRLPLARAAAAAEVRDVPAGDTAGAAAGWRVLVVDDNDDAAAMLREALEHCGNQARTARDALSALSVAEEFTPDVALLDIGLPVINGYELARQFRSYPSLERMRLIAITGYGQESDRAQAEAAGFDAHLVKPVDLDELVALIDTLAREPRPVNGAMGDQRSA